MQFTENEMTVAVDAAARHLFQAGRAPWRRARANEQWEALPAFAKYQHRATAGEMVLPTLTALPDRPTYDGPPKFTFSELSGAAETGARALLEHRNPGGWERLPARKRKAMTALTVMVTRLAISAMPVRREPAGSDG